MFQFGRVWTEIVLNDSNGLMLTLDEQLGKILPDKAPSPCVSRCKHYNRVSAAALCTNADP